MYYLGSKMLFKFIYVLNYIHGIYGYLVYYFKLYIIVYYL